MLDRMHSPHTNGLTMTTRAPVCVDFWRMPQTRRAASLVPFWVTYQRHGHAPGRPTHGRGRHTHRQRFSHSGGVRRLHHPRGQGTAGVSGVPEEELGYPHELWTTRLFGPPRPRAGTDGGACAPRQLGAGRGAGMKKYRLSQRLGAWASMRIWPIRYPKKRGKWLRLLRTYAARALLLLLAGLGRIMLLGEQFEAHRLRAFIFNFKVARHRSSADV